MNMISLFIILLIMFFVIRIFFLCWNYLNRRQFDWNTNNGKSWAVVTGATDGIGFEFARQLALKGYNIMMISRNEEKLAAKRQLILNECSSSLSKSIQIRTLAIDFKQTDYYDKIRKFLDLDHNDIAILINNVGMGPLPAEVKFVHQESVQSHMDMINVNIVSTTQLTDLILPSMVSKRNGLIINISSFAAIHATPFLAVYSATKSYILHYSRILWAECERYNVLVYTLTPASVCTNLFRQTTPSLLAPSARNYVQSALATINWTTPESYGYFAHWFGSTIFLSLEWLIGWQLKTKILENVIANSVPEVSVSMIDIIRNVLFLNSKKPMEKQN